MSQLFNKYKQWLLIGIIGGMAAISYLFLLKSETANRFALIFLLLYLWIVFSIIAWFFWIRLIKDRLAGSSKLWNGLWLTGCLLGGLWLVDNIPLVYPTVSGEATFVPLSQKILFLASSGITIGLVMFVILTLVAWKKPSASKLPGKDEEALTRALPEKREETVVDKPSLEKEGNKKVRWLVYAVPMILSWLVYLLAFWPGMMSSDSIDQWGQMLRGHYVDHHPAFHTFIIWFLTRIYLSPAVVAIAQIISLALVAGAILAFFETLGVNQKLLWIASILFAIIPVNGTMVNTLWKDIPYSTALLGFSFLILKLVESRGKWLTQNWRWLILGFTAAMVMLIRYNGPPIILGVFLLLFLFFYKQWKPLFFSAAVAAGLFFGIRGPVFQLVHVAPSNDLIETTTSLYTIAANSSSDSASGLILATVSPISSDWDCSIISRLSKVYQSDPHREILTISKKAINLATYMPEIMTYYYQCRRSIVWIIWDPHGAIYNTSHVQILDDPNPFGIIPDSKIPQMRDVVTQFVNNTAPNTSINWLVWRPALYLYLFIFIMAIQAARTRNLLFFLVTIPVFLQSVESTIIMLNPNFRYFYAVYLMALLFWPLIFSHEQPAIDNKTSAILS